MTPRAREILRTAFDPTACRWEFIEEYMKLTLGMSDEEFKRTFRLIRPSDTRPIDEKISIDRINLILDERDHWTGNWYIG